MHRPQQPGHLLPEIGNLAEAGPQRVRTKTAKTRTEEIPPLRASPPEFHHTRTPWTVPLEQRAGPVSSSQPAQAPRTDSALKGALVPLATPLKHPTTSSPVGWEGL